MLTHWGLSIWSTSSWDPAPCDEKLKPQEESQQPTQAAIHVRES